MKLGNTSARQSAGWILALSAFAFAWPVDANAQWTVINLHPAGASRSWARDVGDGQQVGFATVDGADHAALWTGSAKSWVDLHPAGATSSGASSVGGGQQVGGATVDGVKRASLWSGTAASWVDLTPAGATSSGASGLGGGQQVGGATVDGVKRASLWRGTAASWLDLTPSKDGIEALSSSIGATDGVQQVGTCGWVGTPHGSLWSGTAASWVDLTPAGAWGSYATGVGGGQQVGYTWFGHPSEPTVSHASLWSGTAASWVNLSPAGSSDASSFARDVHGGQQVGQVFLGASLWSGTPESWVYLHAFLSRKNWKFSSSTALGIWHDATHTYVVGYGSNSKTGRQEALMWRAAYSPPPAPGITVTPFSGLVTTESGGADTFSVVLDTQPSAPVSIGISSSDPGEGTPSPTILVFDGTNWDQSQTVTVTGVDDAVQDGNVAYTLVTAPAVSADLDYAGLDADDVSATNFDDDQPQVIVGQITPNSMNAGATVAVQILGSGFASGASVTFEDGTGPTPTASIVVVVDAGTITAEVSVGNGGPRGARVWDVRVTNPNSSTDVLEDAFTVVK